MKKFLVIAALLAIPLFAQTILTGEKSVGFSGVGTTRPVITWGADSSWKLLFIANSVYRDSANLGTVWKRIDNTADSCSNPIWLGTLGGTMPFGKYIFKTSIRKVSAGDSGSIVFRIQTRDLVPGFNPLTPRWQAWMPKGLFFGTTDMSILDTILVNIGTRTAKTRTGAFFQPPPAAQARLCPDDVPSTTNDSLLADSSSYEGR